MSGEITSRPAIAVVIPAYNGAETLTECLECLAAQTSTDFRVIVLENCSTDGTPDIVKAMMARDDRFSMVSNTIHLEPLDNFRKAVEIGATSGDYFCLRACDDYCSDDYLERLHEALVANPDKLVATCDVERISPAKVQRTGPNPNIFDFPKNYAAGRVPRNLTFPTEWFYGMFRATAKDRLVGRWHEKPNPWAFASYVMSEFVMLDLFVYVPGPTFKFTLSDRSRKLVGAKTLRDKMGERLNYTFGTFALREHLPRASAFTKVKLLRMCWNDARRKTGYRIFGFV